MTREKRGNDHAVRLAKRGAAVHGLTKVHLAEAAVLCSIAYQAARWAGEVRVLVQDAMQRGQHQHKRLRCSSPGPVSYTHLTVPTKRRARLSTCRII